AVAYFLWFTGDDKTASVSAFDYLKYLAEGGIPWTSPPAPAKPGWFESLPENAETLVSTAVKLFTTFAAAIAAFVATGRAIVFGPSNNAKFYSDLSGDPLARITRLFKFIVSCAARPVAIFIDDLDRCDEPYVVDLLNGIQVLFRSKRVAYLVAADRDWIRAA